MNKKTIIITIVSIVGPLIFAAITSTDNVWNTPKFYVEVIPNNDEIIPVDAIIRTIYQDHYPKYTAEWFRGLDRDSIGSLRDRFSSEDMWILWRVYDLNTTNGVSQKIIIKNEGNAQAQDVLIQILGINNFKLIDYTCPELMSSEQITKEHGKKYLIVKPRMSVQLDCEIIINSVGENGVERVIVTANDSHPFVWPDNEINDYRNTAIMVNIFGYVAIGIAGSFLAYLIINLYQEKLKNRKEN